MDKLIISYAIYDCQKLYAVLQLLKLLLYEVVVATNSVRDSNVWCNHQTKLILITLLQSSAHDPVLDEKSNQDCIRPWVVCL